MVFLMASQEDFAPKKHLLVAKDWSKDEIVTV